MSVDGRVHLDEILRTAIAAAFASKIVDQEEVLFLLARMLPELGDRERVFGHVLAAFDLAEGRVASKRASG